MQVLEDIRVIFDKVVRHTVDTKEDNTGIIIAPKPIEQTHSRHNGRSLGGKTRRLLADWWFVGTVRRDSQIPVKIINEVSPAAVGAHAHKMPIRSAVPVSNRRALTT